MHGPVPLLHDYIDHSACHFGGKVALQYVADKRGELDRAWIIDSTPGARPNAAGSDRDNCPVLMLADGGPCTW